MTAPRPGERPGTDSDERIDLRSSESMERWTKALGVSREQLAKAVEIAGDRADEVSEYLQRNGPPATTD